MSIEQTGNIQVPGATTRASRSLGGLEKSVGTRNMDSVPISRNESQQITPNIHQLAPGWLARLIRPTQVPTFFAKYWESRPLHVKRSAPSWLGDLIRLSDVDILIANIGNVEPNAVRIVKNVDGVSKRVRVPMSSNGQPNLAALLEVYHDGHTIIVNSIHGRWPRLAHLCDSLSTELGHQIGINLYLTPPNAQGFDAHIDGHDVFILQVRGTKKWEVFAPQLRLPLEDYPERFTPDDLGDPVMVDTLSPGHLLYLPRGFIHRAVTGDVSSLHLTVSIHTTRWPELLRCAIDAFVEHNDASRETVPAWASPEEMEGRLHELLEQMTAEPGLERRAVAKHLRRVAVTNIPVAGGRFEDVDRIGSLTLSSELKHRPGIRGIAVSEGLHATLYFGPRVIRGPSTSLVALEYIVGNKRFIISDIPGALSDDEKIDLAGRLLRDGFVTFLDRDDRRYGHRDPNA